MRKGRFSEEQIIAILREQDLRWVGVLRRAAKDLKRLGHQVAYSERWTNGADHSLPGCAGWCAGGTTSVRTGCLHMPRMRRMEDSPSFLQLRAECRDNKGYWQRWVA